MRLLTFHRLCGRDETEVGKCWKESCVQNRVQYAPTVPHLAAHDPLYVIDLYCDEGLASASQAGCRRFDPGLPLQFFQQLCGGFVGLAVFSIEQPEEVATQKCPTSVVAWGVELMWRGALS